MGVKLGRSPILRDERRPSVFESRVLRRIFDPKRDEVPMEWRKVHNEELNDLHHHKRAAVSKNFGPMCTQAV